MNRPATALAAIARQALAGTGAHVDVTRIFSGLAWTLAGKRPRRVPHSIYQQLNHMLFWQDWAIEWLDGEEPLMPEAAVGSWPGSVAPGSAAEWADAVKRFDRSLYEMQRRCTGANLLSARKRRSRLSVIQTVGAHNSYHGGQVVLLRQMLDAWPPPGGGLTW